MKNSRRALFHSIISLVLCFSMLIGTTYAWFTDTESSMNNIIQSGNLDIEMYWNKDLSSNWTEVEEDKAIFDYDKWEPGYTEVRYVKIVNEGNLAFKYMMNLYALGAVGKLADVIDVYYVENPVAPIGGREALSALTPVGVLSDVIKGLLPTAGTMEKDDEIIIAIALKMRESAGNEYMKESVGDSFTVQLIAAQLASENDAFGKDYDTDATFPEKPVNEGVTAPVENENGQAKNDVELNGTNASAKVPAGTKLEDGAKNLTLTVTDLPGTDEKVVVGEGETAKSFDVHIDGVASDNDKPIPVDLGEVAPKGMNGGNLKLTHMENGQPNAMTFVEREADLSNHNEFYYDPATGRVVVYLATFSEVAMVADNENAWEGNVAEGFNGGEGTKDSPYVIANADQLAYFNECISNDNENYGDKHYKLVADINLGGEEGMLFYPIGYHKVGGEIATVDLDDAPEFVYQEEDPDYARSRVSLLAEDGSTAWYTSGGSFKGIFDGNGHTIGNIYQNTWQLKGNYSGNYWNAAMGLFGYVNGGTVKNLTVDNFSSDGEFTPTGVIAAYAANSTFENIAITNCNPRVYNTGNGGIVGIGGNTSDPDSYKLTFTNITIDNTNKISALWGSWDVACGGLVGMFRGAGHVYMTNCHVAAQIDVYNDVCGNYQYYWYRYSGMMIGTNKNMKTDTNGYTVPETNKFHAENCTVHFGDWNDYYYCELVANSLASYTHDHQFSRLTEVKAVNGTTITPLEEDEEAFTVPSSGRYNYVVVNGDAATENATCYHFVNGKTWTHDNAGTETVNGGTVLKEDKQHYYLPFNQLFTGYGWGVKHIPVYNGEDYAFEGITILDREVADSVVKFESVAEESYTTESIVKVGDLFKAASIDDEKLSIKGDKVQVTISPVGENSTAGAVYSANTTDWTQGTLTFSGIGTATITITDYYFCTPTTINVTITERQPEVKFDVVMNNGDFLHRVGNSGTVALDKLFKAKDGLTVGTISVTVEAVDGTGASGTYSNNAIQFSGTGVVKVTVTDNDYCIPTELYLEVVDAVNATTATSATANNVVLLNDCGFGSLEVSGGYTLYGNGFTMTCGSDSAALDMGYSFVTLNNGTLDNVQIICPNFDYAVLYKSNMTESGNRSETTDKTRYFNVKSGVMASGNSQILNSRISGGRAAVNVSGGNVVIDNSRIELGAVASLLVGAANSVTLRDITLVQKPTVSTYDKEKSLMGLSVLVMCTSGGVSTPITLEGTLIQNAWVDEDDKQYVPEDAKSIIDTVMAKEDYLHDIDGDGTNESLNLGFAYMPADDEYTVSSPDITDNRTNSNEIAYGSVEVSYSILTTYVYSYKNTNGTADSFKTESEYKPNTQSDIITVTYSDTSDGLTTGKSYSTDGWVYELNVDLDKLSGYALDFSKLSMSVNGVAVTDFKVNGNAKPTSSVAVVAGGTTYTLTATVNGKEYTATYKVTGTETSKESPSLVASNYEAGLCVASSYGGTWSGAAPALEGIQIKYWSVAEKQYKTITLSDYTPTTVGKQNGTNTTWTYSPDNSDFTLTLTGGQVHSGNSVNAMPVVCDGKLYFVAASSNGLVNSGNSARTVPVSYSFKDNNNGDVLTFSHTWSVAENKDAQYKYSDFCNGTLTKLENCITPDTLVTLADGTQVRVDSLTGGEELLVWNMETGMLDSAPIMFVDSDPEAEFEIVHLYFSDGTDVKVIYEHGFWDYDLNKYVYLDASASEYIGHTFAKQNGEALDKVQLVDVVIEKEVTTAWSPVTVGHLCYFVNGMLSMPGGVGGLFNIFEVDAETMTYDLDAMAKDIETYGLFTYEELNAIAPLSEAMFEAAGGAYLKISIGKGNLTIDELVAMINRYSVYFD